MAFVTNNRTLISHLFLQIFFCSQQQGRQQRVELERHPAGYGTAFAIRQQLPDSARRERSSSRRAHLMRYISIFHELFMTMTTFVEL
jgi:hypothetical protein